MLLSMHAEAVEGYLINDRSLSTFPASLPAAALDSLPVPVSEGIQSTPEQAIAFLDSLGLLSQSSFWPNVEPNLFLENLRTFTLKPLQFYEGKGTNFCAYSAITYLPLTYDPLGFSRFMIRLYQTGQATMGRVSFKPGGSIRREAGLIRYKGVLDISPAGQMWFLILADQFKGYLNTFNRHFQQGDENTLWASTNFAKFNRMVRKLFGYRVHARGSDLIRPSIEDLPAYLQSKLSQGPVFLYLNNRILYTKRHTTTRFGIPTHFVLLMDIYRVPDGRINIVYWDYGKKSLQQVTPALLKKIVFGVSDFKPVRK